MDFANDPSALRVQAPVQTFLHTYVVNSVKERVVLGPEERAMVRTLNSAYSVIEVWRRLIASADFKVLRGERRALRGREKYLEADRLFLRWEQEGDKRDRPAYLISCIPSRPSRSPRTSLYPDGVSFSAAPLFLALYPFRASSTGMLY